ncbi:MAG: shikimate dehydrogenase [Actinomycetes bacterium]
MTQGPRRAAVLGSPVRHSLSPVLHRTAYDVLGLAGWTYDAYDVEEPALPGFLAGLDPSWAGLSLTMPLKAVVLPLLDLVSPLVRAVGAANTVVLGPEGRSGENTDVPGLVAALKERGVLSCDQAVVLGAGATARSTVAALSELGAAVTVFARSLPRRNGLAETADAVGVPLEVLPWERAADGLGAPLVVNTTPAGAADALALAVPRRPGVLFDVLYEPWPTPLASAWQERDGEVLGGLDLLVHQAVLQVALMTGRLIDVPSLVPVLRAAGERAILAR